MKPHPRIRKTVKWGGAVVTVGLVAVWAASGRWRAGWATGSGHAAGLRYGYFAITYTTGRPQPYLSISPIQPYHLRWESPDLARAWNGWYLILPCWAMVAITAPITALAWRLDPLARRRERLGKCPNCNYDRTGLAAGAVCPECGTGPVA